MGKIIDIFHKPSNPGPLTDRIWGKAPKHITGREDPPTFPWRNSDDTRNP